MHSNAPLTLEGRRRLVDRIERGYSITAAAESMCISRQCASKWWNRYLDEGLEGLADRSSRPRSCPHQTSRRRERKIIKLRRKRRWGPARIGMQLRIPSSTVHAVLVRNGLNRLRWIDRPTGLTVRTIHTDRPGQLVHIDVKKLARIPHGGGQKKMGRTTESKRRSRQQVGYGHIHTAIDAYSRLAYSEFAGVENRDNCVAFLKRAHAWFKSQHITIERVLTDNGNGYRSYAWADTCQELGIKHTRTKPYHPQTNGKVERFNRTLTEEWAYAKLWTSDQQRAKSLDGWLYSYNHHRNHTAINGTPHNAVTNHPG